MKKTILLLIFSFATIVTLFAQVSKHGSLRVNGTILTKERLEDQCDPRSTFGYENTRIDQEVQPLI